MEHDEVVQTMSTERYLLGELTAEDRDRFEEHLFSCAECAMDVRAASEFIAHSKIALSSQSADASAPASRARQTRPIFRFWPLLASVSIVILLVAVAYQNWVEFPNARQIAALAQRPQLLSSATLVSTRDGVAAEIKTQPGTPALLSFEVGDNAQYSSYVAELYSPIGILKWSLPIPADAAKDTINIQASGLDTTGTYMLVLRGIGADGKTSTEIHRYTLRAVGK